MYGTCTRAIPASRLRLSIVRWCWLPLPPEAYASAGCAVRAYSMNSEKVRTGSDGWTESTKKFDATVATGTRSRWTSIGMRA